MNKALGWCFIGVLVHFTVAAAEPVWQIHEWGTFTSLQDESGRTIGGINTDDEPVPRFVHGAFRNIPANDPVPRLLNKGLPFSHPDVTMRLETPVIYFHPPAGAAASQSATVQVRFRGGWLTEYYPNATADDPGLTNGFHLRRDTMGSLTWNNLQVGGDWPLTEATQEGVWTSPRNVDASLVRNEIGESEKFVFYRGVGHIDAPIRVCRDDSTGELRVHSHIGQMPLDQPLGIRHVWLVDIQPGGSIAFRRLPGFALGSDTNSILAGTPATFAPREFSTANLERLKSSLKSALVADGLFPDEAQALLNTWQVSYFKSPGLRVFFIAPTEWTDFYLPLKISLPSHINRVMVGRVELITREDRAKLRNIARLSPATIQDQAERFYKDGLQNPNKFRPVYVGRTPLSAVISVPQCYQDYLDLGRFRNAMLLDERKTRPTPGLTAFITAFGLEGYQPAENPSELSQADPSSPGYDRTSGGVTPQAR